MREIKFRIYGVSEGEYIDRYDAELFFLDGSWQVNWNIPNGSVSAFIDGVDYILEQFTGLKDKNKDDMYAGDLVIFKSLEDSIIEIELHDGAFGYWVHKGKNYQYFCSFHGIHGGFNSDDWTIVGNIHENPELLKNN